jgi:hypothetical protein
MRRMKPRFSSRDMHLRKSFGDSGRGNFLKTAFGVSRQVPVGVGLWASIIAMYFTLAWSLRPAPWFHYSDLRLSAAGLWVGR